MCIRDSLVAKSLEFVDEPTGAVPLILITKLRSLWDEAVRRLEQDELG